MKLTLFIFTFFTLASNAQFAVVKDSDGYTNVRSEATIDNNVIDSLQNGQLIFCLERKGNWTNIDYSKNNKELNGYIYKDTYKIVDDYASIPIVYQTNSLVRLSKDSIEITVTQKPFDKSKHKFKYYDGATDQIELIDGSKYWGDDGEMPSIEYDTISIKIGQQKIVLPKEALQNLFEPDLYDTQVNFDKQKNIIYIHSMNSDGAGSYEIIWKIEKGIYKERLVVYGF